jgi:hypothetical protein
MTSGGAIDLWRKQVGTNRKGGPQGKAQDVARQWGNSQFAQETSGRRRLLFPIPHSPFPIPHSPFPPGNVNPCRLRRSIAA